MSLIDQLPDVTTLFPTAPSFPNLTGGIGVDPKAKPASTLYDTGGTYGGYTLTPGISGQGNLGSPSGLTVTVPGVQDVGNALKAANDFFTLSASKFFLRGGIEAIGVIFLVIGLIMLVQRSGAEAAAQALAAAVSK